jgi:hypothetical protein
MLFSCNRLVRWIAETFHNCVVAAYEQIQPFDGFGQIMYSHFKKLGSPLKCILKYPSELDQIARYKSAVYNVFFLLYSFQIVSFFFAM